MQLVEVTPIASSWMKPQKSEPGKEVCSAVTGLTVAQNVLRLQRVVVKTIERMWWERRTMSPQKSETVKVSVISFTTRWSICLLFSLVSEIVAGPRKRVHQDYFPDGVFAYTLNGGC